MSEPILLDFPESEKLKEAFKLDPLNDTVQAKTDNQSSYENLPYLSSQSMSREGDAMSSYLHNRVFGRKRKSERFRTKIGPKEIKLDPSRVVVFKKGRLLNTGYFIIEFSYTKTYF